MLRLKAPTSEILPRILLSGFFFDKLLLMPSLKIGATRPLQVIFNTTADEDELLTRGAFQLKISKNALIRKQVLPADLPYELKRLRRLQKSVRGIRFRRGKK